MGIVERLFGKKQHVRRGTEDDDTDPSGYTRVIGHDAEAPPAREAGDPWAEPTPQGPRVSVGVDPQEAPTAAPRVASGLPPSPPRHRAAPPPPRREADYDAGDDATVLGPVTGAPGPSRVVAVLLGVEGPLQGHVIRLSEGENVIGREGHPDPLPKGPETKTISRQHARLRADAGDFMIEPMRPENATYVNDQLIDSPQLVSHGDRIRLGATKPSTFVMLVVP